ncbi:MAG TPA: MBL fold metallo-hydrolase [Planctomycetota bacterium]|nr:MBL fold metallo-hydrolase [Planctomycetota bacterium]
MTGAPSVRFDALGIEVENGLLWLDARKRRPLGLVTHAHLDHVARHEKVLSTPETAALMRRRRGAGLKYLERRYGERTLVGDVAVTLVSAGHILGSAMALLESPKGRLLYTGDVRPEGGLTCPPAEPVQADVLIMEATFGRPEHRFPPAAEVRAQMVAFAREALAEGATPVFLAYALGKAQEVMTALGKGGIPVAAHPSVWAMCEVYRGFGLTFPGSRRLQGRGRPEAAVVVPPQSRREVRASGRLRTAAVTGWGDRARGADVERVFRLSDHADYDALVALARAVAPSKIHVVHGYAPEFAADLRALGFDAEAVEGHRGPDEDERPGLF